MFLFSLLRYSLWGGELPAVDGVDWRQLLRLAQRQGVAPVVAEAVAVCHSRGGNVPLEVLGAFAQAKVAALRHSLVHQAKVAEVVRALRDHGIECVVLKGQGAALYYPEPATRVCGDIDVYVGDADFDRAVALSRQLWPEGHTDDRQVTYKHYHFHAGRVMVELHRTAIVPMRWWRKGAYRRWHSALDERAQLRYADIGGERVALPPTVFDAVYLFYHALTHIVTYEGVGLRQLCDWCLALRALDDDERRQVADTVRRLRLVRPWRILGGVATRACGLPPEALPLYSGKCLRHVERLLDMMMRRGDESPYISKKGKGYWHKKLLTLHTFCVNFKRVWFVSPADVVGALAWYSCTGAARAVSGWRGVRPDGRNNPAELE